jgi:hypothetical protein
MSHLLCQQIFEARLATWAAARVPALRIAYQNAAFSPAAGETYLRAFTLPSITDSQDLRGQHREYQGIFQVNVIAPIGKGSGPLKQIVAELGVLFPLYLYPDPAKFPVMVYTPVAQGPAITDDSTYTVPASVSYRADVNTQ